MILSFGFGEKNVGCSEVPAVAPVANTHSIWCVPFLNSLFCRLYLTNENVGDQPMGELSTLPHELHIEQIQKQT